MKRDHNTQETTPSNNPQITSNSLLSTEPNRAKPWHHEEAGDDELMAVLGYKMKSSDMAEIAQKLQLLEQVMNNTTNEENPLTSDAVQHYNPSDLNSWLQSMISEIDSSSASCSDPFSSQDFGSDLTAIPGEAVLQPNKKLKSVGNSADRDVNVAPARPLVLVDSQENGIRLVHTLVACAEAVHARNFKLAEALLNNIGFLAVSQAGAMRKVATYFAEALARITYGLSPTNDSNYSAFTDLLQVHFYETCPYLKFAHFTANQAILEAFSGKSKVHVVDFGIKQGMQWPALLQALALQPGGPPSFRLTGIGPPSKDNTDYLQQVGLKLAQFAESINVEFQYRGFVVNSLADLDSSIFDTKEDETVAVNSIFELHQLLARPGGIEKVLNFVKELRPRIFTVVEQEANHNASAFLDRFNESLHYYSTLFDSLESCNNIGGDASDHDRVMSEVYLGRQICNVVACEGADRVERHETLEQWRSRLGSIGFKTVHLGSNAYKQASMLLALYGGGDGYGVEENNGCLMLGWHSRPLIATSAWKL